MIKHFRWKVTYQYTFRKRQYKEAKNAMNTSAEYDDKKNPC
jgi:hypothetical protein